MVIYRLVPSRASRAVSGWGGGCVNLNIWPPSFRRGGGGQHAVSSKNKTSPKIFQTLISDNGGLKILFQTFLDLNFSENSLIFNTFRNSSIPGLFWTSWATFLLFFGGGGCYTPLLVAILVPRLVNGSSNYSNKCFQRRFMLPIGTYSSRQDIVGYVGDKLKILLLFSPDK